MSDRTIRIRITEGAGLVVACFALAAIMATFARIGDRADLSFYATIAQIIPVFLLAFVVDARTRMREHVEYALVPLRRNEAELREIQELERRMRGRFPGADTSEEVRGTIQEAEARLRELRDDFETAVGWVPRLLRDYAAIALVGEGASLAALVMGRGSTFVFFLSASSLIAMVFLWIRSLGAPFRLAVAQNRFGGHTAREEKR